MGYSRQSCQLPESPMRIFDYEDLREFEAKIEKALAVS